MDGTELTISWKILKTPPSLALYKPDSRPKNLGSEGSSWQGRAYIIPFSINIGWRIGNFCPLVNEVRISVEFQKATGPYFETNNRGRSLFPFFLVPLQLRCKWTHSLGKGHNDTLQFHNLKLISVSFLFFCQAFPGITHSNGRFCSVFCFYL